jgi:hypothetical protein
MNNDRTHYQGLIKPGSRWRHFQGGLYEVLGLAAEELHGKLHVVYKSLDDGFWWIMSPAKFLQPTTWKDAEGQLQQAPRFTRIPDNTSPTP